LIGDGVVPGNTGRNYICRMIIRRAVRFASKLGIKDPFLSRIAHSVIENYGDAYPELIQNRKAILENLTREEERFAKTLESGLSFLNDIFNELKTHGQKILTGQVTFDLYATHGLPFEITRDIARENGFEVDEAGFKLSMDQHRLDSGAGKVFGIMGGDVDVYRSIFEDLQLKDRLSLAGVHYDPYHNLEIQGEILALIKDGVSVFNTQVGDEVEVILPDTCFYIESGGQVSDTGKIIKLGSNSDYIEITSVRKPAAGIIVHCGIVKRGEFKINEIVNAVVDRDRRKDIMRNHTATHLLHAVLHKVLGAHARQAGSLVAPDRLRFDFNHPEAISQMQLEEIEHEVNLAILANYPLKIVEKSLTDAMAEGAMALFGEKYGERVRTITIGEDSTFSYELCGGTHVDETGDIGLFIIISEGSTAASIRRIEAITGREAYEYTHKQIKILKTIGMKLNSPVENLVSRVTNLQEELDLETKESDRLRQIIVNQEFTKELENIIQISDIPFLAKVIQEADINTLRNLTDRFKEKYPSGVVVLGSVINEKPMIIAAVTDDLISRGLHAGNIVKMLSGFIGGGGGGRPQLAQAGGKDPENLNKAINSAEDVVRNQLKS
jgi:alanyl-tRNA synthetase